MDVCLWTWSCQFLTAAVLAEQPRPQLRCTVSYIQVFLVAFRPMHVRMKKGQASFEIKGIVGIKVHPRVLFSRLPCPKQQPKAVMFDAVAIVL